MIAGWEEGLQGVREGERLQLDIPSDLAYGERAQGELIGENEDLTFVIDVRTVIPAGEGSEPTEAGIEASEGATETVWEDIVVGEGETLEADDTAVFHFVIFRGDSLQPLQSSWGTDPVQVDLSDETTLLPGMLEGMPGMNVGGRRAIVMPPEDAFGPEGNPQLGLPADTDMLLVVDLLGLY